MTLILRTTKVTCRGFPYHPPPPLLETFLLQRVVGISATASAAPTYQHRSSDNSAHVKVLLTSDEQAIRRDTSRVRRRDDRTLPNARSVASLPLATIATAGLRPRAEVR